MASNVFCIIERSVFPIGNGFGCVCVNACRISCDKRFLNNIFNIGRVAIDI